MRTGRLWTNRLGSSDLASVTPLSANPDIEGGAGGHGIGEGGSGVVVTGPNDTDRAGGVLGGGPSGTLVPPGVYTLPMLVPTRGVRGVSGSFCTKGLPMKAFGDNRSINGMLSGTRSPGGFIGTGSRSNKLSGSALTNLPLP